MMKLSIYDVAENLRKLGIHELEGAQHHPLIQWGLMLCRYGSDAADEIPWCSAWVHVVVATLGLQMTRSAAARSWLLVGQNVPLAQAQLGDIVILKRGNGPQPGPNVIDAPGHVGFFAGRKGPDHILVLGGNQGDAVTEAPFRAVDLLGIRRLALEGVKA